MFENSNWIASNENCNRSGRFSNPDTSTLMRSVFKTEKLVEEAFLYICGLGIGVYWLNGHPVSDEVLATPFTNYDKRVLYSKYDITPYVCNGKNVLAIHLGNGRYNHKWASWQHHQKVIFEVVCRFTDGTVKSYTSDINVKAHSGPAVFNHAKSGEIYDSKLEPKGWKNVDFDDSAWCNTIVCRSPGGKLEYVCCPPIKKCEILRPCKIGENRWDTGENVSGWVKIKVRGKCGDRVQITYAEYINLDGTFNDRINIFAPYEVKNCDTYILSGTNQEEYEPSFVYHGFRYFDIKTNAAIIDVNVVVVHNAVERIGEFKCSNETLNEIHKMCERSTLTNLHWIPTDCPHREQDGWTADAMLACEQASMSFDMQNFYKKWLDDIADTQKPDGQISCIVPGYKYNWGTGVNWDSALILIPYYVYRIYGNLDIAHRLWDNMKLLMCYFEKMSNSGLIGYGLGDWFPPPGAVICPAECTETAMYYLDLTIMAMFAKLFGDDSLKYESLADKVKKSYLDKYLDNNDLEQSQTFLAVNIYCGIYDKETAKKKAKKLSDLVIANGYHIDCGFVGSKCIFSALSDYGYIGTALKMVLEKTMPSYSYWVGLGMTTLCENWNLVNNDDGFMASLNHPAHSEVNNWFYRYLAGIRYEGGKLTIDPYYAEGIDWINANHGGNSVYWNKEELRVKLTCGAAVNINGNVKQLEAGEYVFKRDV